MIRRHMNRDSPAWDSVEPPIHEDDRQRRLLVVWFFSSLQATGQDGVRAQSILLDASAELTVFRAQLIRKSVSTRVLSLGCTVKNLVKLLSLLEMLTYFVSTEPKPRHLLSCKRVSSPLTYGPISTKLLSFGQPNASRCQPSLRTFLGKYTKEAYHLAPPITIFDRAQH